VVWFLLVYGAEVTAHSSPAQAWEGEAGEEGAFSSCLSRASALLWRKGIKPGSNLETEQKKVYLDFSEASLRSIHF